MFWPMSCTSPFTVAITTRPLLRAVPSLLCSMNGIRWATARFITRALFTTCGRNILPEPNRSPTTFMPSISGPSMTCSGRSKVRRFLRVLDHEIIDPLDQSMLESLRHRERAPLQVRLTLATGAFSLEPGSHFQQLLRCIRTPVQHDVLHHGAQIRGDLLVDGELAGVDDSHVHASGDRVVEEHRVHRLAYRVVAAERERDVAHPTAHHHTRHPRLDLASRLDKSQPVTVVLLDTRGDG